MMPLENEPLCSTNQVGSESPQVPNLGSPSRQISFHAHFCTPQGKHGTA